MKFISFKNWIKLFESKEERYGCVMLKANISNWKKHLELIEKEDLYDNKEHDYGYSDEPHITILYGIHHDEVDLKEVYEEIKNLKPVEVTINKMGMFENDDYDVIKYDIPTNDKLSKYRKIFEEFPNTQTFKDYKPHMTIAYVKKGEGKKYVEKIKPFKVKFNVGFYSSPEYDKKYFKLD